MYNVYDCREHGYRGYGECPRCRESSESTETVGYVNIDDMIDRLTCIDNEKHCESNSLNEMLKESCRKDVECLRKCAAMLSALKS